MTHLAIQPVTVTLFPLIAGLRIAEAVSLDDILSAVTTRDENVRYNY